MDPVLNNNQFHHYLEEMADNNLIGNDSINHIVKAALTSKSPDHFNNRLKWMVNKGYIEADRQKVIFDAFTKSLNNTNDTFPTTATTSSIITTNFKDDTVFIANDLDYLKKEHLFTREDFNRLQFAENCCSFPKLAVYLSKVKNIQLRDACRMINSAANFQFKSQLTPHEVLTHVPLPKRRMY